MMVWRMIVVVAFIAMMVLWAYLNRWDSPQDGYTIANTPKDPQVVKDYCYRPQSWEEGQLPTIENNLHNGDYGGMRYGQERYRQLSQSPVPIKIQERVDSILGQRAGPLKDQFHFHSVLAGTHMIDDKQISAYTFLYEFKPKGDVGYTHGVKVVVNENGKLIQPIDFPCVLCQPHKAHFSTIPEMRQAATQHGYEKCADFEEVRYIPETDEIAFVYERPHSDHSWIGCTNYSELTISVHDPRQVRERISGCAMLEFKAEDLREARERKTYNIDQQRLQEIIPKY